MISDTRILDKSFFDRKADNVAKDILGKIILKKCNNSTDVMAGKIVEVEAYCGEEDEACHASSGKTQRNKVMYKECGLIYIYLIYGMYYMLNFVTNSKEIPEAILIRALEPLKSIDKMRKNRGVESIKKLTNGPGKLTEALEIDMRYNGTDVTKKDGDILVIEGDNTTNIEISERIGVEDDSFLRFYDPNSKFVSKK